MSMWTSLLDSGSSASPSGLIIIPSIAIVAIVAIIGAAIACEHEQAISENDCIHDWNAEHIHEVYQNASQLLGRVMAVVGK